jgi:hypothetical protein
MLRVAKSGGRPFLVAEISRMLIKLFFRMIRIYDHGADRGFTLFLWGSVVRGLDVFT